jgi:hypothetical protein
MKKKYTEDDWFRFATESDIFGHTGDYSRGMDWMELANNAEVYEQFCREVHITHNGGTEPFPWEDAAFACTQYCLEKAGY